MANKFGAPLTVALAVLAILIGRDRRVPTSRGAELSPARRAEIAAHIYHDVRTYFGHWPGAPDLDFDRAFATYLDSAMHAPDRRAFDLATMAFIARLHNGHTWFTDRWLRETDGQSLGFSAARIDGQWVVTQSAIPALHVGDVIERIGAMDVATFVRDAERYIPASHERAAATTLFDRPYLVPERFTLSLRGGRRVIIDRSERPVADPPERTTGRWIVPNATALITISGFDDPSLERDAVRYVTQFASAKTLIIDVRGNRGGSTPIDLIRALMDRPFRFWSEPAPPTYRHALFETSPVPLYVRGYRDARTSGVAPAGQLWAGMGMDPASDAYRGRVILLTDGGCFSACEDFTMILATTKRAVLVGETTAGSSGQPFMEDLDDGMRVGVGAIREFFPDGSPFEGVGIKPDVEVHPTLASIRAGTDPVLERAEQLAAAH